MIKDLLEMIKICLFNFNFKLHLKLKILGYMQYLNSDKTKFKKKKSSP